MLRRWTGILCALAFGCADARPAWVPRNIVLVTVDTLRADHLGCYGYPRPTSPFIDWMAQEGVLFERAITASSTTVPAHATLLSGLYPAQHRLRRNGQRLPGDVGLLAEVLAARGYETAAFTSTNGHFVAAGLDRGFSRFDEPGQGLVAGKVERKAQLTVAIAARWLRNRHSADPLFLWIHLFDPHSPYAPEKPLWLPAQERPALATFLMREHRLGTGFFGGSEALMVDLVSAYDGEVLAVDTALRDLYGEVTATIGADTLWIVTADHGEGLGNHDWLLHGKKIHNEQLRVPLIYHAPGRIPPARIQAVAEHVDFYPTLLELVGAEAAGGDAGREGRPPAPLLRGAGAPPAGRRAFSERRSFQDAQREAAPGSSAANRSGPLTIERLLREALADNREPGERYAIQDERFKLIWSSAFGAELYDLKDDPYETMDLAAARPELARELLDALQHRLATLRASAVGSEPEPVAPEARRALEALGYVDP